MLCLEIMLQNIIGIYNSELTYLNSKILVVPIFISDI